MSWVLVYTTNTEVDAQLMSGLLESEEVPTQVVSQIDSSRALTIGGLAVAKVYVPIEFAVQAEQLIQQTKSAED